MLEAGELHRHFDGNVHGAGCREHVHLVSADSTQMPKDTDRNEAAIPREGEQYLALEFFALLNFFSTTISQPILNGQCVYYLFIDRHSTAPQNNSRMPFVSNGKQLAIDKIVHRITIVFIKDFN
ncbi:hypothetical protein QLX08_007105 [Tetragonisca angustula]|uniref:Uncharacterized protein n=1 Tax=Tetragonisca angustula TaxID=166442 RepID=A0AAW0ZR18_9HYME